MFSKLEPDRVLALFKEQGVVVRTPSDCNPLRIRERHAEGKRIRYERYEALLDQRGKSACLLMPGVPLSPYFGASYFLIYDHHQLDIMFAVTTDASIVESAEIEMDTTKTPPKPRHRGYWTDYSRHIKKDSGAAPRTIDGIADKMRRLNVKRLTAPSSQYFGFSRLGHTELLIKIKPHVPPESAIIGVGIYKKYLSHDSALREINGVRAELVDTEGRPLPFYQYDPDYGLTPLDVTLLTPHESMPPLLESLSQKQDELTDARQRCFNTARFAYQEFSDSNPLYLITIENIPCNFKKIQPEEIEEIREIPPKMLTVISSLRDATTEEQIELIEYNALAFIYLLWLFNRQGASQSSYGLTSYKPINNLSSFELQREQDVTSLLPRYRFHFSGEYGGKKIQMDTTVAMISGIVTLHGTIAGYPFCFQSNDVVKNQAGFLGDKGALLFLEEINIKQRLPIIQPYLPSEEAGSYCISGANVSITFNNEEGCTDFLEKMSHYYPEISYPLVWKSFRITMTLTPNGCITLMKRKKDGQICCVIHNATDFIERINDVNTQPIIPKKLTEQPPIPPQEPAARDELEGTRVEPWPAITTLITSHQLIKKLPWWHPKRFLFPNTFGKLLEQLSQKEAIVENDISTIATAFEKISSIKKRYYNCLRIFTKELPTLRPYQQASRPDESAGHSLSTTETTVTASTRTQSASTQKPSGKIRFFVEEPTIHEQENTGATKNHNQKR